MTWGKVNPEYEARYSAHWTTLSRDTKRMRQEGEKVRCSCCGELHDWDFVETHHTYYLGDGDTPGLNIFPVCGNTSEPGTCHHWLHLKDQWHHDKADPVWGSGNYQEVVDRLRIGWQGTPHLIPYDFDWRVVARVCAGLAGIAFLVAAFAGAKGSYSTNSADVSAEVVTVSAPAPYNATNVRDSPNGSRIIGTIPNGTKLTATGKRSGEWCQVESNRHPDGWVWCKFTRQYK
jgi:hypothetical protein